MNSRVSGIFFFLLVVISAAYLWWPREQPVAITVRKPAASAQPAPDPAEAVPAPVAQPAAPARQEPPPPQYEIGTVDFGALNFHGEAAIKRYAFQPGPVVVLAAKPVRDGSLSVEIGTVEANDPETMLPYNSVPVAATPDNLASVILANGATVKFTPRFSLDPADRGITALGEVDLRGGEVKSFRLKSGRTLTVHVELDTNGKPLLACSAYEPGAEIGSNPFVAETNPLEPDKPFIQELGDEAVQFTPVYEAL